MATQAESVSIGKVDGDLDPFPALAADFGGAGFKFLGDEATQEPCILQPPVISIREEIAKYHAASLLVSFDADEARALVAGADGSFGQHAANVIGLTRIAILQRLPDFNLAPMVRVYRERHQLVEGHRVVRIEIEQRRRDNWVLTPHPGEAARLLGCSTAEVQADRFAAARSLQQTYGGVTVLKGNGSLVTDGSQLLLSDYGNPGMASGGMGDVLSGVIGALLAQRPTALEAAALGVCLHGAAADLAAEEGQRGLLASDLIPQMRALLG